jgi:huntingtin-interacting protein 1-related protein
MIELVAPCTQAKQMQIDELLHKIDAKDGEVRRMTEEKEQELLIMQEGMDSTLQELQNMRLVSYSTGNIPKSPSV